MTNETRKLAEDNHTLIYWILQKHRLPVDEYYGAAAIGLCKAAEKFDPTRGFQFSTFAGRIITNEIFLEMRRRKRWARESRLDEEIAETSLTLGMQLADPCCIEEVVESEDAAIRIREHLAKITDQRDREIIALAAAGVRQAEIGQRVGISQTAVSRHLKALRMRVTV